MIRLMLAALLALGVHAVVFCLEGQRTQPKAMVRQSRAVSIDLVTFRKPVEKPMPPPRMVQPEPKPKPKPIPKPRPKLKPKPLVKAVAKPVLKPPPPAPIPSAPEPQPEPAAAASFDADIDAPEPPPEPSPPAMEEIPDAGAQEPPAVQVSVPRYDLNPPPHYPRVARRRNYQGTVMLDVRVTVDGRVAQVRIAKSSGYAILDQSAQKSVKNWQFTPARQGDRHVEMWVQVPVRYVLK